jgi:hypothetical protein
MTQPAIMSAGHFVLPDVLSPRTFCPMNIMSLDVLSPRTFCLPDVFSLRMFCPSGSFILPYVLYVRMFCPWMFCFRTFRNQGNQDEKFDQTKMTTVPSILNSVWSMPNIRATSMPASQKKSWTTRGTELESQLRVGNGTHFYTTDG